MSTPPLLHVITERVDCEPRGVTFVSNLYDFERILVAISRYQIDTNSPLRGLQGVMAELIQSPHSLLGADLSGDMLESDDGEHLTLDFARGEVSLHVDDYSFLRSSLTPEGVIPLAQCVANRLRISPFMEAPPLPQRACVRLVTERYGDLASGMNVLYPACGPEAIAIFLANFHTSTDFMVERLLTDLWWAGSSNALMQPFQGELLGDEYAPTTPPPFNSNCPMLTIDIPEQSLRLSSTTGELLMVVDFTEEAIERVLAVFEHLTDTARPAPLPDYGPHPDYEFLSVSPF